MAKKKETDPITSMAAGALGRKGGASKSKAKLESLRKSGLRMRGQPKNRRTSADILQEQMKDLGTRKVKKDDDPKISAAAKVLSGKDPAARSEAAKLMGEKGGKSKSPKKLAALLISSQKAGIPKKETYDLKKKALLGVRGPIRDVFIPDVVAKHPKKYMDITFAAYSTLDRKDKKKKRYKVRVVSYKNGEIRLKQSEIYNK